MKTLNNMTKDERSLLLFFETCAVDHGGLVKTVHISEDDFVIAENWNEDGFIRFGRLTMESVNSLMGSTHWCELSDNAWELAHMERRQRYQRINDKRVWQTTEEKRNDCP